MAMRPITGIRLRWLILVENDVGQKTYPEVGNNYNRRHYAWQVILPRAGKSIWGKMDGIARPAASLSEATW